MSEASQQRDCSGFTPDSLLIHSDEHPNETNSRQRYVFFSYDCLASLKKYTGVVRFIRNDARVHEDFGLLPFFWGEG